MVEKQVRPILILYYFKLFLILQKLDLVFLVVKLMATFNNPIFRRCSSLISDTVIIDKEEK